MSTLLEVKDLNLEFKTARGTLKALNGITFHMQQGEVFGIVGETYGTADGSRSRLSDNG